LPSMTMMTGPELATAGTACGPRNIHTGEKISRAQTITIER
jgi:hypothetical protein